MERGAYIILFKIVLFIFLINKGHSSQRDIEYLKKVQQSLIDPDNNLKSTWNFESTSAGFICNFNGVECWHDKDSKVLNLRLSNMNLQGNFPLGLEDCGSMSGLDLSNNNLSGSLPSNISKLIPYVTTLDLSFNSFSGGIPTNMSNCAFLNVLNLQHNRLTGTIPFQFAGLNRLTTFNVADNLLSGPIPSINKNGSFPASDFANNNGLCGNPLDACEGFPSESNTDVIIGFAVGFVAGGVIYFFLLNITVKKKNITVKKKKADEENKWAKNLKGVKSAKVAGKKKMDTRRTKRGRGRGGSSNQASGRVPNARNLNQNDSNEIPTQEDVITQTQGNGTAPLQNATVPRPTKSNFAILCKQYAGLGGKPFKGTESILEVQAWLRLCDKIFKGMGLEEEQKRPLATWQLQDSALIWWESRTLIEPEEDFSWERFKEVFEEQYVPEGGKDRLYQSFVNLVQADMTIEQYTAKFNELSRYAPELIISAKKKNERYILGLKQQYRNRMTAHIKDTFVELIDMAYQYETIDRAEASLVQSPVQRQGNNNNHQGKGGNWKKRQNNQEEKKQGQSKAGGISREEFLKSVTCFNCQRKGHYAKECRNPKVQRASGGTCNNCHQSGHWRRECPLLGKAEQARVYAIEDKPSTSGNGQGQGVSGNETSRA